MGKQIIRLTNEQFIEKSKQIHGNIYDYSRVDYQTSHVKVKIICLIHGEFKQTPNCHINGSGCPTCGKQKAIKNRTYTTEEFITRAKSIHKDRYDYSKFEYIHKDKNGIIICPIHGNFWQSPNNHLKGKGCKKCNFSIGEIRIEKWLNDNNIKYEPQKRFKDCVYKKSLPFDFYLVDKNICIEYDGSQHYKPHSFSNDKSDRKMKENHDLIKVKDDIKTKYCVDNNIKLIRIPYFKFHKIEKILNRSI